MFIDAVTSHPRPPSGGPCVYDMHELFASLSSHCPPDGGQGVGSRLASINMALLTEGRTPVRISPP